MICNSGKNLNLLGSGYFQFYKRSEFRKIDSPLLYLYKCLFHLVLQDVRSNERMLVELPFWMILIEIINLHTIFWI